MSTLVLVPPQARTPPHGLSIEQRHILDDVTGRAGIIKITGGAGTGKSTLIKELQTRLKAVVVTPTNKAAAVLKERGCPAATAYSVFFTCEDPVFEPQLVSTMVPTYEAITKPRKQLRFTANDRLIAERSEVYIGGEFDDYNGLSAGKLAFANVIILDEASMVPYWMITALARMSNLLILVGDDRQLAPIGDRKYPRGYFNSLKANYELTKNFRQSDPDFIAAMELLKTTSGQKKEVWELIPKMPAFEPFYLEYRPKIICWRRSTVNHYNALARNALGFVGLPKPGESIITNTAIISVDGKLICNGTEGTVIESHENGNITAQFNGLMYSGKFAGSHDGINFAYAITTHKAQGSEWPVTAVVNEVGALQYIAKTIQEYAEAEFQKHPEQAKQYAQWLENRLEPPEASRRWAYTALTRGRKVFQVPSKK